MRTVALVAISLLTICAACDSEVEDAGGEAGCDAAPACDVGDEESASECAAGCYAVELCGTTVYCTDLGQEHGCPPAEPAEGEPCSGGALLDCAYPPDAECPNYYQCGDGGGASWVSVPSGCGEP